MTDPTKASERDTVAVSDLPPPPPPAPPAFDPAAPAPDAPVPDAPAPAASSPDEGWDWDRAKDVAERWFRPLAAREGWMALAYLFVGAVAAPFLFGAMMAASAITFGLSFVVVGLFLVAPVFALIELFGRVEHHLADLAGHRIELRPPRDLSGVGFLRTPFRAITDPVRWRYAGFVAVNVVMAPLLFAVGSFPLSFVLQAVFGDGVINGPGFSFGTGFDVATTGLARRRRQGVAGGSVLPGQRPGLVEGQQRVQLVDGEAEGRGVVGTHRGGGRDLAVRALLLAELSAGARRVVGGAAPGRQGHQDECGSHGVLLHRA